MATVDALPEDMPGLRAAALVLLAERDELLRRVERIEDDALHGKASPATGSISSSRWADNDAYHGGATMP
jgi:hypothetical protein